MIYYSILLEKCQPLLKLVLFNNRVCIQWGNATIPAGRAYVDITFPLSFSNSLKCINAMNIDSNATTSVSWISSMDEASTYRTKSKTRILSYQTGLQGIIWMCIGF